MLIALPIMTRGRLLDPILRLMTVIAVFRLVAPVIKLRLLICLFWTVINIDLGLVRCELSIAPAV